MVDVWTLLNPKRRYAEYKYLKQSKINEALLDDYRSAKRHLTALYILYGIAISPILALVLVLAVIGTILIQITDLIRFINGCSLELEEIIRPQSFDQLQLDLQHQVDYLNELERRVE